MVALTPLSHPAIDAVLSTAASLLKMEVVFVGALTDDSFTFERVRIHRHRGILGVNYRYEILFLASQFLIDMAPPSSENSDLSKARQWTLSLEAGVFF